MLWEILSCLECEIGPAQQSGWSYEAAIVSERDFFGWSKNLVPGSLRKATFASQQECLVALRRALPVRHDKIPDSRGQLTDTTHHHGYVEEFEAIPYQTMSTSYHACFHRAPITS